MPNKLSLLLFLIFPFHFLLANFNNFSKDSLPKIEMVKVESGTFYFRLDPKESKDTNVLNQHKVMISEFYISKYEVTESMWQKVMEDSSKTTACEQCPVVNVSYDDVQQFIQKLNAKSGKNYRLPTEAEWEFAAKGAKKSKNHQFSGSENIKEVAYYMDNGDYKLQKVGQLKSNELGIFDMSGNVWEWCSDWHSENYTVQKNNPRGPSNGNKKVIKGGSFNSNLETCKINFRHSVKPDFKSENLGFRLVTIADK